MSIFVQVESIALLRLPLAESPRHRTTFALQGVATPVADLHRIFEDMPDHLMRQMASEPFSAMVPETNTPLLIHDVNPCRQVFHEVPEQFRIIEKVREHDEAPPSSFIGRPVRNFTSGWTVLTGIAKASESQAS